MSPFGAQGRLRLPFNARFIKKCRQPIKPSLDAFAELGPCFYATELQCT